MFYSCNGPDAKVNTIQISLKNAHPYKIYLYQLANFSNSQKLVDSTYNTSLDTFLNFKLPDPDQQIYQLIVSPYLPSIFFLNDSLNIKIDINLNDFLNYSINGSKANQDFVQIHKKIFTSQSKFSEFNLRDKERKELQQEIDNAYFDLAKNTKYPEVALFAAGNCNFDNDVEKLSNLTKLLKSKFQNDTLILEFIRLSQKYIDTKTKEYNVGDSLPSFMLKDLLTGDTITNTSPSSRIVVYDFFSVLQRKSIENDYLFDLRSKFNKSNIQIYSFPVEADSILIDQYIKSNKLEWPHFSDYLGWQGDIIPNYFIDSIPYLFVTDEHRKIIHKNIPISDLAKKLRN